MQERSNNGGFLDTRGRNNDQSGLSSKGAHSPYSLPKPPPTTWSSSSSSPAADMPLMDTSLKKPFIDVYHPSPPPVERKYQPYAPEQISDDESAAESGVELSFQPEDDISTLGESIMSHLAKEPDGYKSDDIHMYKNPPANLKGSSSALTRSTPTTKLRKTKPSSRHGNHAVLAPVKENSDDRKQKIDEIMNRVVDPSKKVHKSLGEYDQPTVHLFARPCSQASSEGGSNSSSDSHGPLTVDPATPGDAAVNNALLRSLYSQEYPQDHTEEDSSGIVYSS